MILQFKIIKNNFDFIFFFCALNNFVLFVSKENLKLFFFVFFIVVVENQLLNKINNKKLFESTGN